MRIKPLIVTGILSLQVVFGLSNITHAATSEEPTKSNFVVDVDSLHLENELNHIKSLLEKVKDPEKHKVLKETEKKLKRELATDKERKAKKSKDGVSALDLNDSYWFWGEGDSAYNSNTSSNLDDHETQLELSLDSVDWDGFSFSGSSDSYWWGGTPYDAYSIKNTISFAATGMAVSGSLNGVNFSGISSGSTSVVDEAKGDWHAGNTFDAFSSGSTIKAVFTSTSSMKKYSSSSTDTTSTQITLYDPSF